MRARPASSVHRSQNGSALVEAMFVSSILFGIIVFGAEALHLVGVHSSVVGVASDSAVIVKQMCLAPNQRIIAQHRQANTVDQELLEFSRARIVRAASAVFPGIVYKRLMGAPSQAAHGNWFAEDTSYGIPDRFNNASRLDDDQRFGEIVFSVWCDPDLEQQTFLPPNALDEPVRYLRGSATGLAGLDNMYAGVDLSDIFGSVQSSSPPEPGTAFYAPLRAAVNGGVSVAVAEMWYEYRPLTGLFRKMLKSLTGRDYRVLHAVAVA